MPSTLSSVPPTGSHLLAKQMDIIEHPRITKTPSLSHQYATNQNDHTASTKGNEDEHEKQTNNTRLGVTRPQ